MITNQYQITDIIKQSKTKSIYRVQEVSNSPKKGKSQTYVIKQYGLSEQKYFNKQLQMYNVVLKDMFSKGFPELKSVGQQKQFSYIVLNELGSSLQELRKRTGGRFTLKTVLMIGLQIIERLQQLHSKGYIQGDIQPANILTGSAKFVHKLYLVDYEYSCPYIVEGKHIEEKTIDSFSGAVRFCSLSANSYKNVSRKDDLQSLFYSLIYLLKGTLPWMELKSNTFISLYDQTAKIKKQNLNLLCEGLPDIFQSIILYLRGLKFQEKPNYEHIRKQLLSLMKKNGYEMDYKYDWTYI